MRWARRKDGERWVCGVWMEYAETAGDTVAEDTAKALGVGRLGSGSDTGVG